MRIFLQHNKQSRNFPGLLLLKSISYFCFHICNTLSKVLISFYVTYVTAHCIANYLFMAELLPTTKIIPNILLQFFLFFIIIKECKSANYFYITDIMMSWTKCALSQNGHHGLLHCIILFYLGKVVKNVKY